MPKTEYRLFHQRTAEKIRDEVSRLRDSLLFGSKKKVHKFGKVDITCDIATLEILLSDYILDYENSEESKRQCSILGIALNIFITPPPIRCCCKSLPRYTPFFTK